MTFNDSVSTIPGIGTFNSYKLTKLNIQTIGDLLYHIPSRYIDYSLITTIDSLQEGEIVTIRGTVISIKNNYIRGRRLTLQKAKVKDATGEIEITWFNQPYLVKNLNQKELNLSGKVSRFGNKLSLESPEYEIIQGNAGIHTGRLVPVYPETKGISSKFLRRKIDYLLKYYSRLPDNLPLSIQKEMNLIDFNTAIKNIHQPTNKQMVSSARRRLAFEELFFLQLISQLRKRQWQKETVGYRFTVIKYLPPIQTFIDQLPFQLTGAQNRVTQQIISDLGKKVPMNRLLQGDVGCGKTVVSSITIYLCHLNGLRTLFMAPTEILAQQHYETLSRLLKPYGLSLALRTGSLKTDTKDSQVIIGTHALLYKEQFDKIGLVVIDEQHRFGVEQRATLRQQKIHPHLLSMTATPIPRTVALTLYGDLDLSLIDELPKGRKVIKTFVVPQPKYTACYQWIRNKIRKNKGTTLFEQAFIIYPLIEESEILTEVKAATQEYQRLKKEAFPDLNLALLHGKMKAADKNKIIEQFRKGEIDILIATSVVEVGIDIPNATMMVIEEADRFGLAQLHQLRGRIGRNDRESYCLLLSSKVTPRLKAMEKYNLGIKLAEIDLKLRGPGEMYGIRQHGEIDLKIANFSDIDLVEQARVSAAKILDEDITLKKYPQLLDKIAPKLKLKIQPD